MSGYADLLRLLGQPEGLLRAAHASGYQESQIRAMVTPERSEYWPRGWNQVPETRNNRQLLFLSPIANRILEGFYGGAPAGGKSEGILAAALQYVHVPGYAALILRRTFSELNLPEALIDRSHRWLRGTRARWLSNDHAWHFPTTGKDAILDFGYLETENDKYRYQSAEYQFVAFDELTQFAETQYTYLFSRLRRPMTGPLSAVPLRMRSASNPGGVGYEWVRERFMEPYFADTLPDDRFVIPATLIDNPFVDMDQYSAALQLLDPLTRMQYVIRSTTKEELRKAWEARPMGGMFSREWVIRRGQLVSREELPWRWEEMRWVRYWDLAATKYKHSTDKPWTAGILIGRAPTGDIVIGHVARIQDTPGQVERFVKQIAEIDGRGVAIRMEQEPGSSGKQTIETYARLLMEFSFGQYTPSGSKEERARPSSAAWYNGLVWVVRGDWNYPFFEEVESFPQGNVKDQVDSMSGGYAYLVFGEETKREDYPDVDLADLMMGAVLPGAGKQ
jgi:predicted phage terminase large subunit-like protein